MDLRAVLFLVFCTSLTLRAENWPRFRGPNGSGFARADIPAQWSEANRKWSVTLPGVGHGSPVVWGGRVFLLCGDEATGRRTMVCLSAADGKIRWQKDFDALVTRHHKFNSMASTTPAVDAERVYFTWGTPQKLTVIACTHDGEPLWEANLGPMLREHGFGSSPILHDDLVILSNDQERDGHLFALDRATGKVRWKLPRAENHSNYSTPCLYTPPGGKPQVVVVSWRLGATGVDAASGRQLWQLPLFAQKQERAIGSPSVSGEFLIVNCAFTAGPKHVVVLKPGATPDTMQEAWRQEKSVPHIPSPLLVGQRAYLWSDDGIVTCAKLATGETVWQERVQGTYFSSPVCTGDKIFNVNKSGQVVAIAAADQFQLLGSNPLDDLCQSTPAIADGQLFVRTWEKLHCVGK